MIVRSAGRTDVGMRRTLNEDAFLCDDEASVYFVADGMGGHAAGEVASQEAVSTAIGMVKRAKPTLKRLVEPLEESTVRAAMRVMESAVQAATYMVFSLAQLDRDKSGMGTTVTGMLFHGEYAITAQVGDSRIYQLRGNEARQLTEDHTLVAWQLRQGIITLEEAKRSPHKNVITRSVGNKDYVQVDTGLVRIAPGDRYLMCTDGLHGYVRATEISEIAELGGQAAVDAFVNLANDRGGKDNVTAVLIELTDDD
jgi:serine/threonine protein phosphatase PrpC